MKIIPLNPTEIVSFLFCMTFFILGAYKMSELYLKYERSWLGTFRWQILPFIMSAGATYILFRHFDDGGQLMRVAIGWQIGSVAIFALFPKMFGVACSTVGIMLCVGFLYLTQ